MNYKGDERYKPISFVVDDLLFKQKCTKNNCEAHEKTVMLLKEFDNVIFPYRIAMFDVDLNRLLESCPYSGDAIENLLSNSFSLYSLGLRLVVIKRLIFTEKFMLESSNECINKALNLLYEENDRRSIQKSYQFLYRRMIASCDSGKVVPYFDKVKYGCFKDILSILNEKDPIVRLKKLHNKKRVVFETLEIVYPGIIKFVEKMYDETGLGGTLDD